MKYGPVITGDRAVLASGHYLATQAGIEIASMGGNAVDMGVAAGFALAVLKPHENGLGGECPIIIYSPEMGKPVAISGQGVAPRRATIDWFAENGIGLIPGDGLLPATVPGTVGAYLTALKRYGTLPLSVVMAPAHRLARNGFPVYPALANAIARCAERFVKEWPTSAAVYLKDGQPPKPGERLINPALANTMERLMAASRNQSDRVMGIEAAEALFYRGDIAREIAEFAGNNAFLDASGKVNGGLLTFDDFSNYQTRIEDTASCDYKRYTVHKSSAWTQGPVFLHQLKLLEQFDLVGMGHNSAKYIHTVVECSKIAFADRERFYGDPAMCDFSLDALLDAARIREQAGRIDPEKAVETIAESREAVIAAPGFVEGRPDLHNHDTTHLDVTDANGLMMSATPSGGWIPSSPVMPSLGFPLGTRGQMFSLNKARPNALMPGKRPRATLTPSMAMRDGKPWMAFGTPGGDMQDQWALQFFLNVAEFGMDIREAMDVPSFHTKHLNNSFYPRDAEPRSMYLEKGIGFDVMLALQEKGHQVRLVEERTNGQMNAVVMEDGWILGAASVKYDRQAYASGW